jgi:hypothetical protein
MSSASFTIGRDISLWLSSKLEEPWSCEKISPFINVEVLQTSLSKFNTLEPNVKLGLLFSFLLLRKKSLLEVSKEIEEVLKAGKEDEDEWVRVISQLLTSSFVFNDEKQNFASGLDLDNEVFKNTLQHLTEKINNSSTPFLPMEFPYLDKKLLPQLPTSITSNIHFKVKKPVPSLAPTKETTLKRKITELTPSHPEMNGLNKLSTPSASAAAVSSQSNFRPSPSLNHSTPVSTHPIVPQKLTPTLPHKLSNSSTHTPTTLTPISTSIDKNRGTKRKIQVMNIQDEIKLQTEEKKARESKDSYSIHS